MTTIRDFERLFSEFELRMGRDGARIHKLIVEDQDIEFFKLASRTKKTADLLERRIRGFGFFFLLDHTVRVPESLDTFRKKYSDMVNQSGVENKGIFRNRMTGAQEIREIIPALFFEDDSEQWEWLHDSEMDDFAVSHNPLLEIEAYLDQAVNPEVYDIVRRAWDLVLDILDAKVQTRWGSFATRFMNVPVVWCPNRVSRKLKGNTHVIKDPLRGGCAMLGARHSQCGNVPGAHNNGENN